MTARTLKDLEEARARLERVHDQQGRRSGSNPNGGHAGISDAAAEVRTIERDLKQAGILPRTEHEVIEAELDSAFPDAAGNDVVTHKGKSYRRRFFSLRKSLRGKVQEWGRSWEEVTPSD